jgi:hypothetical protein
MVITKCRSDIEKQEYNKNVMGTCLDTFANKIKATGKYFNYNI